MKGAGRSVVDGGRVNIFLTRQTGGQEAGHAKLISSRRDDTYREGPLEGLNEVSICKARSAEPAYSKRSANGSDARLPQLCSTLGDPTDCSPPGSSVHGILQARILEWVMEAIFKCKYTSRGRHCSPGLGVPEHERMCKKVDDRLQGQTQILSQLRGGKRHPSAQLCKGCSWAQDAHPGSSPSCLD